MYDLNATTFDIRWSNVDPMGTNKSRQFLGPTVKFMFYETKKTVIAKYGQKAEALSSIQRLNGKNNWSCIKQTKINKLALISVNKSIPLSQIMRAYKSLTPQLLSVEGYGTSVRYLIYEEHHDASRALITLLRNQQPIYNFNKNVSVEWPKSSYQWEDSNKEIMISNVPPETTMQVFERYGQYGPCRIKRVGCSLMITYRNRQDAVEARKCDLSSISQDMKACWFYLTTDKHESLVDLQIQPIDEITNQGCVNMNEHIHGSKIKKSFTDFDCF